MAIEFADDTYKAADVSATSLQGLLDKLVSQGKIIHTLSAKFPMLGNLENKEAGSILKEASLGTPL